MLYPTLSLSDPEEVQRFVSRERFREILVAGGHVEMVRPRALSRCGSSTARYFSGR
jgi:hypothetical protein